MRPHRLGSGAATPRLHFGWFKLYDGLPVASVAIAMLAVAEFSAAGRMPAARH